MEHAKVAEVTEEPVVIDLHADEALLRHVAETTLLEAKTTDVTETMIDETARLEVEAQMIETEKETEKGIVNVTASGIEMKRIRVIVTIIAKRKPMVIERPQQILPLQLMMSLTQLSNY